MPRGRLVLAIIPISCYLSRNICTKDFKIKKDTKGTLKRISWKYNDNAMANKNHTKKQTTDHLNVGKSSVILQVYVLSDASLCMRNQNYT